MLQKGISMALLLMLLWSFGDPISYADRNVEIQVRVEGRELVFGEDAKPLLLGSGVTMVPFRPIFEAFGLKVRWEQETQSVTGESDLLLLQLHIGGVEAKVNGRAVKLPMAPRLVGSTTYVPLRFIGEATGRQVDWNEETLSVSIGPARDPIRYEGEERNGVPEGQGKLYMQGSLLYEGGFRNGKYDGQGRKYYANGSLMYDGSFVDGAMEGRGKLHHEDGTIWYDAEFVKNEVNGFGTWYAEQGHRIVGQFRNGVPDGPGEYYYGDGTRRFVGTWRNGTRNGFGTWYYANGTKFFEGQMELSNPVEGKLYYETGALKYEGKLNPDYAPHGAGTLYEMDGSIYHQGQFDRGKPVK